MIKRVVHLQEKYSSTTISSVCGITKNFHGINPEIEGFTGDKKEVTCSECKKHIRQ